MKIRETISQAKRIVVKIGTNVLMQPANKKELVNALLLRNIASQVVKIHDRGKEVVIVSSGSIGFGASELHESYPITDIRVRQACAAVGQPILMRVYKDAFRRYSHHCGQLLLTGNDFVNPSTYMALKDCIEVLFEKSVIPIVNENDSISIEEISVSFGDNDSLSAMLTTKIDADLLIMLTDVDAVYDKNPKKHNDAKKLSCIDEITLNEMLLQKEHAFDNTGSHVGTGGMKTKLQAAQKNMERGTTTVIALAHEQDVLMKILDGVDVGTVFCKDND